MWYESPAIIRGTNNANKRSRHLMIVSWEVVKSVSAYGSVYGSVFYFSFEQEVYQYTSL